MSEVIASTEDWVYLCKEEEVVEGAITAATHPRGTPLAICKVDGELFAFFDRCTHGAASFVEDGELNGSILECGFHNGTFDVRTGEALTMPCRTPLRKLELKLMGGEVYLNSRVKRFEKAE